VAFCSIRQNSNYRCLNLKYHVVVDYYESESSVAATLVVWRIPSLVFKTERVITVETSTPSRNLMTG
jgi:hypothetical protein